MGKTGVCPSLGSNRSSWKFLGNAPVFITRDGDSNQEDITNDAVRVWQAMPCYHFELHDNPGVSHVALAFSSPAVRQRLLMHLQQPRSRCPSE